MTWRRPHTSSIRCRSSHRSPKKSLPKPDLQACKSYEDDMVGHLSHLKMKLSDVAQQINENSYLSVFISPAGNMYGGKDSLGEGLDHHQLSDQAGAFDPTGLQSIGFIRIYFSRWNDLSIQINTKPTKKQTARIKLLIENYPERDLRIITPDPYSSSNLAHFSVFTSFEEAWL